MNEFSVSINNGPVQKISVKTGLYWMAVITALSILDYEAVDGRQKVKIWCDHLLPDYGPYMYECDPNGFGSIRSVHI